MESEFEFLDPGPLVDGELRLELVTTTPADPPRGWVPDYTFHMFVDGDPEPAGRISLRIGNTEDIRRYFGHIGYGVEPEHRGYRYAARACALLLPLARRHGFETLWITCDPDNVASRRTCERAGATLVEVVDVPPHLEINQRGDRLKCRYRLDL